MVWSHSDRGDCRFQTHPRNPLAMVMMGFILTPQSVVSKTDFHKSLSLPLTAKIKIAKYYLTTLNEEAAKLFNRETFPSHNIYQCYAAAMNTKTNMPVTELCIHKR